MEDRPRIPSSPLGPGYENVGEDSKSQCLPIKVFGSSPRRGERGRRGVRVRDGEVGSVRHDSTRSVPVRISTRLDGWGPVRVDTPRG